MQLYHSLTLDPRESQLDLGHQNEGISYLLGKTNRILQQLRNLSEISKLASVYGYVLSSVSTRKFHIKLSSFAKISTTMLSSSGTFVQH